MEPRHVSEQQDRLQVVDVREVEERDVGRIPGSRWIPMDALPQRLGERDAGSPAVTVCRSGRMADYLADQGYQADNLDGGIAVWAEEKLPVRRPANDTPGKVA
ncbi:rhodanese-like domain-containing protein [Streptomonospora salina]|uniref:Rhodanese-related sulfurtransferase n=1 Tax=Streptomonospora salina TaxID=104205 RepID=A0A841E2X1_9ACTN|nr:rhodanese-like domain-containing protein [Streptomonospora salina]MBB5998147.1 rhodanese-related sulfurtransferase [Streptomonospora salina]